MRKITLYLVSVAEGWVPLLACPAVPMRRPTALLGKPGTMRSMVVAPENSYAAFRNRNYSVSGVGSSRRVGGKARPHSRGNLRRSGMRPGFSPKRPLRATAGQRRRINRKGGLRRPRGPTRLEKAFFLVLLALILAIPLAATVKCYRRGLPLLSGSDSEQYYAILRAFVFHGDADLRHELFQLTPSAKDFRGQLPIAPQTGRIAEKHTVGWAVVGFVPYLGVHACYLLARHLGCGPAILTGYELPYQVAAGFAQLAAGWLGLIFTYRLCRRYFAMWPSLRRRWLPSFSAVLCYAYCGACSWPTRPASAPSPPSSTIAQSWAMRPRTRSGIGPWRVVPRAS